MQQIDTVLVAIVNHDTPHLTARAVTSARRSDPGGRSPIVRVVVVNAACTPSGAYRSVDRDVKVVDCQWNVGFGTANNMAVASCPSGWQAVLLLNSDAELQPGCLRKLVDSMERDSSLGAVGPQVVGADGALQMCCARRLPNLRRQLLAGMSRCARLGWLDERVRFYPRKAYVSPIFAEALDGACVLVRREMWEQLGGFDERFFMYWEDVKLFADGGRSGWRFRYEPEAACMHLLGRSAGGTLLRAQRSSEILFMSTGPLRSMGSRCLVASEACIVGVKAALRRAALRDVLTLLGCSMLPVRVRPFELRVVGDGLAARDLVLESDLLRQIEGRSSCVVACGSTAIDEAGLRLHGHVVSSGGTAGASESPCALHLLRLLLTYRPVRVTVDRSSSLRPIVRAALRAWNHMPSSRRRLTWDPRSLTRAMTPASSSR